MFLVCQNGTVFCLLLFLISCFLEFYCVFRSQWFAADILIALKEKSNADRALHATIFPKWAHWKRSIREYHGPVSQPNLVGHQFRIRGEHRHLQLLLKQMYGMIRHMLQKESSAVAHFMHETLLCFFFKLWLNIVFSKVNVRSKSCPSVSPLLSWFRKFLVHLCDAFSLACCMSIALKIETVQLTCSNKYSCCWRSIATKYKPGLWHLNACLHIWYGDFCAHCRSCA